MQTETPENSKTEETQPNTQVSAVEAANTPSQGIYVPQGMDPGDTPEAGDVDPDSTRSADETGQGGDVTETKKRKALDWNG